MQRSRLSPIPWLYAILVLVPLYWLAVISLKRVSELTGRFTLFPRAPTLENYAYILTDSAWSWGYLNAVIYVVLNVLICILVAVPAAYGFSRYRFPGDQLLFFGLLAFRMVAPAVLLVPFVQIFSDLDLIDTYLAVALAHCFFNIPIAIWILEGFISAIPREIDEAARVDGYTHIEFFGRILLPLLAPGIAVTAFFCFMFSWIEALLSNALTMIDAKPISGIMSRAGSVLAADLPLLAAAGVVGLLPGILLIGLLRHHLARGFSMGRVI